MSIRVHKYSTHHWGVASRRLDLYCVFMAYSQPRSARALTLLLITCGLWGCQGSVDRPRKSLNSEAVLSRLEKDPAFHFDKLVADYYSTSDPATKRAIRDKVIDLGVLSINENYSLFVDDMVSGRKGFETTADIGAIVTAAAATLVVPPGTKSILAAVSGGLVATKSTVSKNYFYEQTLVSLVAAMEAQRREVETDLLRGASQPVEAYALSAAFRDLQRYYFAGTIDGALAGVQRTSSRSQEASNAAVAGIRAKVEAELAEVRRVNSEAGATIKTLGIEAVRSKMLQRYNALGADSEERATTRLVIASHAVIRLSDADLVPLLAADRQAEAAGFLGALATSPELRVNEFVNKYSQFFDVEKYIRSASFQEADAARLIAGLKWQDILK